MGDSRFKAILKASIIGIVLNLILAAFKALVGVLSGSIAIVLDAVNNLTDAMSSLITMIGTKIATKDPTKKHPFGHGRTEYLATTIIAGLILYAGITAFVESVRKIFDPVTPDYSKITLLVVIGAIFVKIFLGLYNLKVGEKADSDSLKASGKDALSDVAISVSTLIAALVFIFTGFSVEAYLGVFISIMILKAGYEVLREAISKLLGEGGDVELVKGVKKTICAHEGVKGAYDLVFHNYGPGNHIASVHVEVDDYVTASQFDTLTRQLVEDVYRENNVYLSAVGLYAINTSDRKVIDFRDNVRKIVLDHEYVHGMHGFFLDEEKKIIRFDMVVSFDAPDRKELFKHVEEDIKKEYPDYQVFGNMDSDFNEI